MGNEKGCDTPYIKCMRLKKLYVGEMNGPVIRKRKLNSKICILRYPYRAIKS